MRPLEIALAGVQTGAIHPSPVASPAYGGATTTLRIGTRLKKTGASAEKRIFYQPAVGVIDAPPCAERIRTGIRAPVAQLDCAAQPPPTPTRRQSTLAKIIAKSTRLPAHADKSAPFKCNVFSYIKGHKISGCGPILSTLAQFMTMPRIQRCSKYGISHS
jgi:hypothetical protein